MPCTDSHAEAVYGAAFRLQSALRSLAALKEDLEGAMPIAAAEKCLETLRPEGGALPSEAGVDDLTAALRIKLLAALAALNAEIRTIEIREKV